GVSPGTAKVAHRRATRRVGSVFPNSSPPEPTPQVRSTGAPRLGLAANVHVTGTVIAGQPYARAAACLAASAMALAGCGGGTAVTELGGPGAPRCQVSLAAEPRVLSADGGSASLTVDAARDCTWEATSTASWVTLSPASGQGTGTIAVSVAAS